MNGSGQEDSSGSRPVDFTSLFGEPEESAGVETGVGRDDDHMKLVDGSRVAVVGGGPSGSMFAIFLLRALEMRDVEVQLDVFEPRDFSYAGPAGCNHCGGIISESLIQMLVTEGISLPDHVVQRGIDSYMLHMDVGHVRIETPLAEKRIAAVYRGNGPKQSILADEIGFDRYLLDSAAAHGANIRKKIVTRVDWDEDGRPSLFSHDGDLGSYDVLVVATGVNSVARQIITEKALGMKQPRTVKTFITEFRLGAEKVAASLGDSMHVFLLPLPRLEFAAVIPKGDYVTVCMLGHEIDDDLVNRFLNSREVRECFPNAELPEQVCFCFPRMNVGGARKPFADRLVLIGDAGVTRLYKDGIGAAYRTAKGAAVAMASHGFSAPALAQHFFPACQRITDDNKLGKLVFTATELVKRMTFARRIILNTVRKEQAAKGDRLLSGVLWDVFTGSALYGDILRRSMKPRFWTEVLSTMLRKAPSATGVRETAHEEV
jgi:flavin-dependent dehydrogenase